MFQGFVHPGLVAGAALAAVPLIIHLLNRQRYKPMEWAAMRFVLAAYRRTRRRVQLENLFLLLLRMGAVALLALAIARPYAAGGGALAPLTEHRRDLVLVIDASASMGYREEVETVFERVGARAAEIIGDLESSRGDRVQLVVAGSRARVFGWQSPDKALSLLSTVTEPTDEMLDLAATLAEVLAIVDEDAAGTSESMVEVRMLTDMQRASFGQTATQEDQGPPPIQRELDGLEAYGVTVVVEDLGPSPNRPANLTLAEVAPTEGDLVAGAPIEVAVRIVNHGTSPRVAERIALSVDGNKLPVQRIDVPAEGAAEAIFTVQFDAPGPHALVAELDGDRLAADDERATVVIAPEPVRVLVVNGSPADELEDDEVGFLMLALEPLQGDAAVLGGDVSPFEADEVTVDALTDPDTDLRAYDVIILGGVAILPESAVTRIEERVASGGALIVALGPRIADLSLINQRLFRADGSGLLPAELVRLVTVARRESYYRVASFDQRHPALSFFADEAWRPFLTEVPLYTFVRCRPLRDARVLAQLDDDASSPLLIERPFDQGRVFLYTSSFNPGWNDVVRSPRTLVPLTHEWLRYAGARREPPRVLAPGTPLRLVVETYPRLAELELPGGDRHPVEGDIEELSDGRWRLPELPGQRTERAGLYVVALDGARNEPFAVQLDPREGDLERLSPGDLTALHPAFTLLERGDDRGRAAAQGPQRGELWRILATLCLLFLIGESLWGAWIGQRRRLPS
jgi:hypothetical protein